MESSTEAVRVLVLPEVDDGIQEDILRHLPITERDKYQMYFIDPIPTLVSGIIDLSRVLELSREIIREHSIQVLYYDTDSAALCAAVLREEFSGIVGPSLESVFLCQHKLYTSCYLDDPERIIPFSYVDADDDVTQNAMKILRDVGVPCVIKPAMGTASIGVRKCFNENDVLTSLRDCKLEMDQFCEMRSLLIGRLDIEKYPLALKRILVVQKLVDIYSETKPIIHQISTEASVINGEITIWPGHELMTLPIGNKPECVFPGYVIPPLISAELHAKLRSAFKQDITKLMTYGFDNSLIHGEYFVSESGSILSFDLNPRACASYCMTYIRALRNGDNRLAIMNAQLGRTCLPPTSLPGLYGVRHWLWTSKICILDDLLHLEKCQAMKEVVLKFRQGELVEPDPGTSGAEVADVVVTGQNVQECLLKIVKIRSKIIKRPDDFPWKALTENMEQSHLFSALKL